MALSQVPHSENVSAMHDFLDHADAKLCSRGIEQRGGKGTADRGLF